MQEIRLLLIDNEPEVISAFEDSVKRFNRGNDDANYKVYSAKTLEEAKEFIKYNKLDTAIVDLNLKELQEDGAMINSDGNIIINEIIENFRMPIFVLTGEPEKLEDQHRNKKNIILCIKGEKTYLELLDVIKDDISSKTIEYFSRDGYLEQKINSFYWKNLQETLDSWKDVAKSHSDEINKILSRHTVACLNEELYVDGNVGSFDNYHPGEMYIIPPIKGHYHTGDIIEKEGEKFIIINPACDIVNVNKLNMYTIVKIIKAYDIEAVKKKDTPEKKEDYIKSSFKKANNIDRYHFLPKFNIINDEYVIDFQDISTVKIGSETNSGNANYLIDREKNIKKYKPIASLSSPFLKDVIARFSSYYARQGQPNLL